jgi:hypothetical protein
VMKWRKPIPDDHDFEIACRFNQRRAERTYTNRLTRDN